MKTAGTAGQAGAGAGSDFVSGMERRTVISLRDEVAFWNCLSILFQRQSWITNVWRVINSHQITLPKLELFFNGEKVLVVFFEKGKLESLFNRIKDFSRIAVIMDSYLDEADRLELSRLGFAANRLGKKLLVIDGQREDFAKFSFFSPVCDMGKILGQFCKDLESGLAQDDFRNS